MLTVNQLIGFGAGGSVATAEFGSITTDTVSRTTYTFSSKGIGNPYPNRYVVVGVAKYEINDRTINSVTVGGVSCTKLVEASIVDDGCHTSFWITDTPIASGTTATIVVTHSGSVITCTAAAFGVRDLVSTSAYDTATDLFPGGSDEFSATIDIPPDGVVFGMAADNLASSWSWSSNVTEVGDTGDATVAFANGGSLGATVEATANTLVFGESTMALLSMR